MKTVRFVVHGRHETARTSGRDRVGREFSSAVPYMLALIAIDLYPYASSSVMQLPARRSADKRIVSIARDAAVGPGTISRQAVE